MELSKPIAGALGAAARQPGLRAAQLAIFLMLVVILAHVGLIPGGQWEGDEYFNLAALHQGGFAFFLAKIDWLESAANL